MNNAYDWEAIKGLTLQKAFAEEWKKLDDQTSTSTDIQVLSSVQDAFEYVRSLATQDGAEEKGVSALITGSVHLVGTALACIENVDSL